MKRARITGVTGRLTWYKSKPDSTLRELMDASRLAPLGWKASIGLEELRDAYRWFHMYAASARLRARREVIQQ